MNVVTPTCFKDFASKFHINSKFGILFQSRMEPIPSLGQCIGNATIRMLLKEKNQQINIKVSLLAG